MIFLGDLLRGPMGQPPVSGPVPVRGGPVYPSQPMPVQGRQPGPAPVRPVGPAFPVAQQQSRPVAAQQNSSPFSVGGWLGWKHPQGGF